MKSVSSFLRKAMDVLRNFLSLLTPLLVQQFPALEASSNGLCRPSAHRKDSLSQEAIKEILWSPRKSEAIEPSKDLQQKVSTSLTGKLEARELFHQYSNHEDPEVAVCELKNVRILDHTRNVVVYSNGRWISRIGFSKGLGFKDLIEIFPKRVKKRGRAFLASTSMASRNYYHWMIECVPRLIAAKDMGFAADEIILRWEGRPFQRETLSQIGFDPDTFPVATNSSSLYQVNQLVGITHPLNILPSEWVINQLRDRFLASRFEREPRRIFISRAGERRCLKNEAELIEVLRAAQFEILNLQGMSVSEQVELFNTAKIIVGSHGAGLTNLVFASSHAKVVEIFNPNWIHPFFWSLSSSLGLMYTPVIAKQDGDTESAYRVEIDDVLAAISEHSHLGTN